MRRRLHIGLDPINTDEDGCGSDGCSECEGDCNDDSQCAGDLECFHRTSSDDTVPGCSTTFTGYYLDDSDPSNYNNWDYCYDRTRARCTETGGYIRREVGNCGSHPVIETAEDCETADVAVGLSAHTALVISNHIHPHGCYFKQSAEELYFNLDGDRNDNDADRVSICGKSAAMHLGCATRLRIIGVPTDSETNVSDCETFLSACFLLEPKAATAR